MRRGKHLLEDLDLEVLDLRSDVASRAETPSLALDLGDRGYAAEAVDVRVRAIREALGEQLVRAGRELGFLAPVQPRDVREELDLLVGELAMRSVDLAEDGARVDEQHPIRP